MGIFKKIRKQSNGWGYRIGTCSDCNDEEPQPLTKVTTDNGNAAWVCFTCLEQRRRTPYVKQAKQEENQQKQDFDNLTSIGGVR
jgi:hypothetical protein